MTARIGAFLRGALATGVFLLASCGDDGSQSPGPAVGGTVTGLDAGNRVVLSNDGADRQTVSANGAFAFQTVQPGQPYAITAVSASLDQDCSVINGSGIADRSTGASISVVCGRSVRNAFRPAASMHAARSSFRLLVLPDGSALAIGGDVNAGFNGIAPDTIERYDPDVDRWTVVGSIPTHYFPDNGFVLSDGRVLLVLEGRQELGQPSPLTWMFFDPTSHAFTPAPAPLVPQWTGVGTNLQDGRLLIAGADESCACMHAEVFDPTTSRWTAVAEPDYQSPSVVGLLRDGRMIVAGGTTHVDLHGYWGTIATAMVQAFVPSSGTWVRLADVPVTTATDGAVLSDGRVLMVAPDQTPVYDPVVASWRIDAPLSPVRVSFALATAYDGSMLAIGGNAPTVNGPLHITTLYPSVTDATAFVPSTNAWTAWQPLVTARSGAGAVRLPNGKILVAGGALQTLTSGHDGVGLAFPQDLASSELGY